MRLSIYFCYHNNNLFYTSFTVVFFQRIEHVKVPTTGYLYGLVQNNAILVIGFSLNESVEKHLPFGFKDLGSVQWSIDGNFNPPGVSIVTLKPKVRAFGVTESL